jgi:hypothetical protein
LIDVVVAEKIVCCCVADVRPADDAVIVGVPTIVSR